MLAASLIFLKAVYYDLIKLFGIIRLFMLMKAIFISVKPIAIILYYNFV